MRFGACVFAAILPLALSSCGQRDTSTSTEAKVAPANEVAAGNDAAPVASSGAQAFVNKAAASDRFEVESSRLVASSAASSAVMAYARDMIAAHTASTAKLKATVAEDPSGIVIDDKLSPAQTAALEDMKMKKGYIFDAAYVAAQVHAHDETSDGAQELCSVGRQWSPQGFRAGADPDGHRAFEHGEDPHQVTRASLSQGRAGLFQAPQVSSIKLRMLPSGSLNQAVFIPSPL